MRDALGSHADHPLPLQRSIAELVPLRSRTISPSPDTDARAIRSQSRDENYAERAATQRAQKHRRRLSTVRRMDRLVVLEHGRIVEQGPHDLLAQGGMYASPWEHQAGGFLALT